MNGPGPWPIVPMPVPPGSAEAQAFVRLMLSSARLPAGPIEPPARTWLDAYRVTRCAGCGAGVVAGSRCRGCGGPR